MTWRNRRCATPNAGFPLTWRGAANFTRCRTAYDHFGLPDFGEAYPRTDPGDWVRQPALARTIRTLAEAGPDEYYKGAIGDAIVAKLQTHGSFMAAEDLAGHAGAWVDPLRAQFADFEVAELPPPTQGVTALEALRIADGFDLATDDTDRAHLLIEAMKCALVDRNHYVGDPETMPFPASTMLGEEWISRRRDAIDPDRAAVPRPDPGPNGGTAYLCAADRDGLLVSLIQTNFSAAGAGLHVGDWGINLQNRGSSFRLDESHPNGLGGGKLPMHTLIPALALRDGKPWLGVRRDGRAHAGADAPAGAHAHRARRRRPASGDHRAEVGGRSRLLARADRRPGRRCAGRRVARAWPRCATQPRVRRRHGPRGTRSNCSIPAIGPRPTLVRKVPRRASSHVRSTRTHLARWRPRQRNYPPRW